MFVFGKILRALLSCYFYFEIRTFDLLPTILTVNYGKYLVVVVSDSACDNDPASDKNVIFVLFVNENDNLFYYIALRKSIGRLSYLKFNRSPRF